MSELSSYIIPIRRHIHQNPEVGFETFKTAAYLTEELEKLGYKTIPVLQGAGIIAKLDLGKKKTIAFRSDMDALPEAELTSLPFKSTNGCMHACGHDGHMAMLMGAAKLLVENKDKLNVNVTLIFQPAEEGPLPGGASQIIKTGLLDDIDMFFAFHVTNKLNEGQCGIKPGPACAAPDLFDVKIHGQGCHASAPQNGVNPIIAASYVIQRFQALADQVKKEDPYTVITTASISAGTVYNIIVDDCFLKGTARSFTDEMRKRLDCEMTKIVHDTCLEFKAQGEFQFHYAYDPVINDETAVKIAHEAEAKVLGRSNALILEKPEMIGEDFAYYRHIAPICLTWLGVRGKGQDFYDLHSPHFLLSESALENGSRIFLQIASDFA